MLETKHALGKKYSTKVARNKARKYVRKIAKN